MRFFSVNYKNDSVFLPSKFVNASTWYLTHKQEWSCSSLLTCWIQHEGQMFFSFFEKGVCYSPEKKTSRSPSRIKIDASDFDESKYRYRPLGWLVHLYKEELVKFCQSCFHLGILQSWKEKHWKKEQYLKLILKCKKMKKSNFSLVSTST